MYNSLVVFIVLLIEFWINELNFVWNEMVNKWIKICLEWNVFKWNVGEKIWSGYCNYLR